MVGAGGRTSPSFLLYLHSDVQVCPSVDHHVRIALRYMQYISMRELKILSVLMILLGCAPDKVVNYERLTNELDSIFIIDQKYRAEMQSVQQEFGWNSPEMSELWIKQNKIDSSNLRRVVEIINEIDGYPGKSLVGYSASKTTFYVLQHAPDSVQEQYYEMIIEAAKSNELDKSLAAMYQDRYLMHKDKPQIYGTQIRKEYETDSLTGEKIERTFVWPIADTTNIDSLRMWNGLGNLEEYLNNFSISRWE